MNANTLNIYTQMHRWMWCQQAVYHCWRLTTTLLWWLLVFKYWHHSWKYVKFHHGQSEFLQCKTKCRQIFELFCCSFSFPGYFVLVFYTVLATAQPATRNVTLLCDVIATTWRPVLHYVMWHWDYGAQCCIMWCDIENMVPCVALHDVILRIWCRVALCGVISRVWCPVLCDLTWRCDFYLVWSTLKRGSILTCINFPSWHWWCN